jgi:hypothetical protein
MRNHMLFYIAISFLIGCYSCAQEKGNDSKQQNIISLAEMEEEDFFDALRLRTDLRFETQKRILYTTIDNIEAFGQMYKGTDMSLEYVIRDRLHTAIILNHKNNNLESMDGSVFDMPQNLSATKLTDEVISLIGNMYYGAEEVNALTQ